MAKAWRVVLAPGEVREVECLYIGTVALAKVYGLRAEGVAVSGQGDNFVEAILDLARDGRLRVVEILAPNEPTRAELAAQLAAVTAERDAAANRASVFAGLVSAVVRAVEPRDGEALGDEVQRVVRERDALASQLADVTAEREKWATWARKFQVERDEAIARHTRFADIEADVNRAHWRADDEKLAVVTADRDQARAEHAAALARAADLEAELARLRWGVVANAGRTSHRRMVRWGHVKHAVGCGGTRAVEMCIAAGFGPDDECGIGPDEDGEGEDDEDVAEGDAEVSCG